jgi:hypothetical protein
VVFGKKADGTPAPNIEKMEVTIVRLTLENTFIKVRSSKRDSLAQKMINRQHVVPLVQLCKVIRVHRTTNYRASKPTNWDQLNLMLLIDTIYWDGPSWGAVHWLGI